MPAWRWKESVFALRSRSDSKAIDSTLIARSVPGRERNGGDFLISGDFDSDRIRGDVLARHLWQNVPIRERNSTMKHAIASAEALGRYIRAARIEQGFTRDELASATGFSPKFISQVEAGKPTAQIGKVLKLLSELGIKLDAESAMPISQAAFKKAARRRRSSHASESGA